MTFFCYYRRLDLNLSFRKKQKDLFCYYRRLDLNLSFRKKQKDLFCYYSCVFGKRNYRVLVRVSVCVFVCVCVFLHDNLKRNRSRNTKLEYIVEYENSSDEFDIELRWIKVKVTVGVQKDSAVSYI